MTCSTNDSVFWSTSMDHLHIVYTVSLIYHWHTAIHINQTCPSGQQTSNCQHLWLISLNIFTHLLTSLTFFTSLTHLIQVSTHLNCHISQRSPSHESQSSPSISQLSAIQCCSLIWDATWLSGCSITAQIVNLHGTQVVVLQSLTHLQEIW